MDWLKGMNNVVRHIEENLTQPIRYESLSRIVGCSAYEFSRIFSFMAGTSVSEYIRRRRLSQAAFDIQNGSEKIIDIALKYCYESPTTFTRAFKELHGTAPLSARKTSVSLKIYPPISFILTVKGVNELKHRIEKRGWMGLKIEAILIDNPMSDELKIPIYNASHALPGMLESTQKEWYKSVGNAAALIVSNDNTAFIEKWAKQKVVVGVDTEQPYVLEKWNALVFLGGIIGNINPQAEKTDIPLEIIPPATWAVFTFDTELTEQTQSEAYARILTEWMPISGYKRDESVPHMEQYETVDKNWEIWLPVLNK